MNVRELGKFASGAHQDRSFYIKISRMYRDVVEMITTRTLYAKDD